MSGGASDSHVFTDYRWNDGSVSRRWIADPAQVDLAAVELRPISLRGEDEADQYENQSE